MAPETPTHAPAPGPIGEGRVHGYRVVEVADRVKGRAIDAAIGAAIGVLPYLPLLLAPASPNAAATGFVVSLVVILVVGLLGVCCMGVLSSTMGYALLGFRFIDAHTGAPPTWKVLGKYALQSALPIAGIVIAIVTMDRDQRNWFDRQLGLQLVHWERRAAATTVRADLQDGERPPHRESVDQPRGPAFPERDAGVQTGSGPIVDLADPTTFTAPAVPALLFDPESPASPPASPVGAPVAAASRPTVVLDTGETVRLDTPVLLGRDPGTIPAVPNARPHQVRDAERSLSKTHLAVGSDEAGVWVMDCHSTNGSRLDSAGMTVLLAPWTRVPVHVGDVVRYGDRSLTITPGGRP